MCVKRCVSDSVEVVMLASTDEMREEEALEDAAMMAVGVRSPGDCDCVYSSLPLE